LLGETRDARAIPVLQRGLKAHGQIQVAAAVGLAELQDRDSIPLIVDACKNAPPEIASTIAFFALVSFDDPRAQSAASIYLTKEQISSFEGKKLYRPFPPRTY
jgi:HEAT repeat protein